MLFGSVVSVSAGGAKHPNLDKLLAQLFDSNASNASYDARLDLFNSAEARPEAKAYIAARLPSLLEAYNPTTTPGGDLAYDNAVRLAGDLKVAGAVPILCKRIDLITNGLGGMSPDYNFLNRAAVGALIQIGARAVPAVVSVLGHGGPRQREEAAYVLAHIGTETAWEAIRDHVKTETNADVRRRLQELLKKQS